MFAFQNLAGFEFAAAKRNVPNGTGKRRPRAGQSQSEEERKLKKY
jgi:hypothetical protein